MVGERGFEPPAPASRRQCSTRLSYSPTDPRRYRRGQGGAVFRRGAPPAQPFVPSVAAGLEEVGQADQLLAREASAGSGDLRSFDLLPVGKRHGIAAPAG